MEFFGLLGERLGHSLSVPIHQGVYEKTGLPGAYKLIEVPREQAGKVGEAMRLFSFRGLNVTIPYKETVLDFLDELTPLAKEVGAVNTIDHHNGRLVGYNTDVFGLVKMLERFSLLPQGGPCAVLGSGGAAKAAVAALTQLGVKEIYVATRDPDAKTASIGRARYISYQGLGEVSGDLLINATPVGMFPDVLACPVENSVIKGFQKVADTIYNPGETVLIRQARKRHKPACTGLYMLVSQAVKAEEIWWGQSIPESVTEEIYQKLVLEGRLNK